MVKWVAVGPILRFMIPGSKAKYQASSADFINCVRHLGQQGRIAETRADNERAELDARCDGRQRREYRPTVQQATRWPVRIAEVEDQMVWHPQ